MENKGFIIINLLPYREKIKKEKLKQFGVLISAFVVAAIGIIFAGSTYLSLKTDNQEQRNKYVEVQNKKLDDQIQSIANLRDEIKDTLAKRQVVEALQVNRSDGVNILNELSKQLPEGVLIKSVKQVSNKLTISGSTPSNSKIAYYMNNLDATPIFENPQIVEIKIVPSPILVLPKGGKKVGNDFKESDFTIVVELEKKIEPRETEKKAKATDKKQGKS